MAPNPTYFAGLTRRENGYEANENRGLPHLRANEEIVIRTLPAREGVQRRSACLRTHATIAGWRRHRRPERQKTSTRSGSEYAMRSPQQRCSYLSKSFFVFTHLGRMRAKLGRLYFLPAQHINSLQHELSKALTMSWLYRSFFCTSLWGAIIHSVATMAMRRAAG